jgi:hypothetical protein
MTSQCLDIGGRHSQKVAGTLLPDSLGFQVLEGASILVLETEI